MISLTFQDASERVKQSLDMIDIVQRHVVLKKSGRNYTGRCPFHNDKNPSMSVSREKSLFKCFSCGAGGDALAFLMRIENKTFGEIIRDLAYEQGIDIIHDGQNPIAAAQAAAEAKDVKQSILALNQRAQQWYQNQLSGNPEAQSVKDYLLNRGINDEAIFRFGIGYAPQGWENLTHYLKTQEALVKDHPELLVSAGLASQRQNNLGDDASAPVDSDRGYYDRFRYRLMIPIYDDRAQVVAFGGRALAADEKAKYLNSPETAVYHKSNLLYGLNWAKDSIRQSKSAIVMEGYFDVISAHLAGIQQAVGSCGTAMTEQHIKLLKRFGAETLYLAFDADEAGQRAALSAIELLEPYVGQQQGLSVKIIVLPATQPYKDPDEFIRAQGGPAFSALMAAAQPFLDFKFDQTLAHINTKTAEGRVEAAQKLVPLLSAITQPVLRSEMLGNYAERVGISQEALILEVRQYEQRFSQATRRHMQQFLPQQKNQKKGWGGNWNNKKPVLTDNVTELRNTLLPSQLQAEKNLLRLTLAHPDAPKSLLALLTPITFSDLTLGRLQALMLASLEEFEQDELLVASVVEWVQGEIQQLAMGGDSHAAHCAAAFAELVMTAEDCPQELGIKENASALDSIAILMQEARQLILRIEMSQRRDTLHNIAREKALENSKSETFSACDAQSLELEEIEWQYRLCEQLAQRRLPKMP